MTTQAELIDRLAIQDVLAVYCRGIDRLEPAKVAEAYWPDAIDDHGIFHGVATEFVPFIMHYMPEHYSGTQHCLGQSYVELDGDTAHAETYFKSQHRLRSDPNRIEGVDGRYVDVLKKREGVWKVFRRVVVIDFMREYDAGVALSSDIPGLTFGLYNPEDASYRLFARG